MYALGSGPKYLRQPWNQFDFFMVVAGYTAFIPNDTENKAVVAIRALRALRPLRTITRFEALRGVIVCFLEVRCAEGRTPVGGLAMLVQRVYNVKTRKSC